MKKREEDDQEFQALRMSHKASIEASGMTRDELIDLLARNLASYNLLCRSYENNCLNRRQVIPPELIGKIAPTRLESINLRGVFRFRDARPIRTKAQIGRASCRERV